MNALLFVTGELMRARLAAESAALTDIASEIAPHLCVVPPAGTEEVAALASGLLSGNRGACNATIRELDLCYAAALHVVSGADLREVGKIIDQAAEVIGDRREASKLLSELLETLVLEKIYR